MRAKLFFVVFAVVAGAIFALDAWSRVEPERLWGGRALAAVGLAAVAASIVTAVAGRLLSGSLRDLRRAAVAMSSDRSVRSRLRGEDEVAALGASLDALAEDRNRTLDGLAAERDRVAAILETMAEAVVVTDAEDRIVLANGSLRALLGTTGQVVGRQILEAVRSDELAELVVAARTSDAARSAELDVLGLAPRRVRVRVAPLAGGQGRGVVAVLSDVSDLRRLESMRRDFVANVSHELRTPVAAIRAAAETLEAGALADPDAAHEFVGIVLRQAERLHQLVEDLLDLSRIEAQRLELVPDRIDVRAFLGDVQRLYALSASRRGVSLAVDPAPEGLATVADRRALEQVLSNLVDNAIKYAGSGGSVRLSAREGDGEVALLVNDDGPGIPPTHLPRLFERFYRVDKGRSREVGGTGLGLAIVKHLVDALGGRVTVESEVGRGSTFTVHLPAAPAPDRELPAAPATREDDAGIPHQP